MFDSTTAPNFKIRDGLVIEDRLPLPITWESKIYVPETDPSARTFIHRHNGERGVVEISQAWLEAIRENLPLSVSDDVLLSVLEAHYNLCASMNIERLKAGFHQ